MRASIANLVSKVDLFPSPALIRIHEKDFSKNCCSGVLSLLLVFALLSVAIVKIVEIFGYSEITFERKETVLSSLLRLTTIGKEMFKTFFLL